MLGFDWHLMVSENREFPHLTVPSDVSDYQKTQGFNAENK